MAKKQKQRYMFFGEVLCFGRVIQRKYRATTWAVSEAKALSNVMAQFKRENDYTYDAKISLNGDIVML